MQAQNKMDIVKIAMADAVLTFMWVFSVSTVGALTALISSALGIQGFPTLIVTTVIIYILVFFYSSIGSALGGASYNPTAITTFYAAGISTESLLSIALRFPAQAAGAVGGALGVVEMMPGKYKHMLGGPSLRVDIHTGAVAEGVLTFTICLIVLVVVLRGPRSPLLQTWLISMSTVTLVVLGSGYTGPSMNPANAFGWAYVNKRHDTWEQLYVYWISPFVGSVLAAWCFRILFPISTPTKNNKKKKT